MSNYFTIDGYWKDDHTPFGGLIVKEYDTADDNDDDVFYYGLSEENIIDAINNPHDNVLEFVITNYQTLS